ncbi:WapI family immunity protein [Paenibacillus sp. IHBB 3054]|uniref:WapI family immunity protein n=1 Tax=Paenibacillus sp. IHBB 3054 TaxID=3425689 RepID=UPI003F677859
MHEFVVRGKKGCFVQITIEEAFDFPNMTSHFGGYDVRGIVEIKSGNYYVKGQLWFSTGEVYQFYDQLIRCMADLDGVAALINSEVNLKLEVKFNKRGQVIIEGYFKEFAHEGNELIFEIESDQSFFVETLDGLKQIVNHYGDMKGICPK